jgi:hypothetical protein
MLSSSLVAATRRAFALDRRQIGFIAQIYASSYLRASNEGFRLESSEAAFPSGMMSDSVCCGLLSA